MPGPSPLLAPLLAPLLVQVAVPLAQINGPLTYGVPAALRQGCVAGSRVQVRVAGRLVTGLVIGPERGPAPKGLLLIEALLDEIPQATARQMELCAFVSRYYHAPLGETVRLALPPDTRRQAARLYRVTDAGRQATVFAAARGLGAKDAQVLASFEEGEQKTAAGLRRVGVHRQRLDRLVAGGFLEVDERLTPPKARLRERVTVLENGDPLPKNAPALAALDAWFRAQEAGIFLAEARTVFPGITGKTKRLVALGRIRVDAETKASSVRGLAASSNAPQLRPEQQVAAQAIASSLPQGGAFLLEGITGSGKTEVYLRAAQACLDAGRGVLFVVPEIALTPQLAGRVQARIAQEVAVLHSGLSQAERRDALSRLRSGEARIALGARSALFSPVQNLGLIIVDEEHDSSFKQGESPRYHGRDVALWRARNESATIVLGSATPSLESRHNADIGKFRHLRLQQRADGNAKLPQVEVIDLRARKQNNAVRAADRSLSEGSFDTILSRPLVAAMQETLAAGHQVLLFLNRRGYAPFLLCSSCGEIRQCPHCSVSLTVHQGRRQAVCHQCDHFEPIPEVCVCGAPILPLGLGTERVEAEVAAHFPRARIARLDRDTTRATGALQKTLAAMQSGEVDVLIGTQMVAKGHDFPRLALVGIVLADVALAMPDFRASERAFSLLTQVAGRAGRGEVNGRVLLQTYNPDHPAIMFARTHDVEGFAQAELLLREEAGYPPFWRVALLRMEGEDAVAVDAVGRRVAALLRDNARAHLQPGTFAVLGPAPAPIEKLRGQSRFQVFLRTKAVKERAWLLELLSADPSIKDAIRKAKCRLILDVDPAHVL